MKKAIMKKTIAVFLSSVLTAGLLAGCGNSKDVSDPAGAEANKEGNAAAVNAEGFPIVNEPVTMTVYGAKDQNQAPWKDVLILREYEKMTNIHMDYQEVPEGDGFEENKQLLFASNELPDVFMRCMFTPEQIANYGVVGKQLLPLEDLIAEYAPNLTKILDENPTIRQAMTASDGHIYSIYPIDMSATGIAQFKQWINKKWLDELGLEIPKNLEEFKEVLIAFRDGDPNGNGQQDEIPLGIRDSDAVYALGGSFGLQHQLRDTYNIDENGKVHNWLCDDEFKEYLMYLNDLYEEKLLWQDYYKGDNRPAWRSNLAGELYGAMYMPYSDVFINCELDYAGYEPLIGPHGDQLWSDVQNGITEKGSFALSSTCKDPAAAIRWVDYFYGEEGEVFASFGIEGVSYELDENGVPRFKDEIINDPTGFMTALGKINLVPGAHFPCYRSDRTDHVVASDRTKEVSEILMDFIPEKIYPKPAVSPEDADRVTAIEQDLINYRKEAVAKFILGEWSFDQWEEYCSTMEQIGIRELEEIYQRAFDAIK
ncbi:extracellular solute-binding protein [Lachnospiraceae bacterium 54-53]